MYLPDTNIFIRALRREEPDASFLKQLIIQNKLSLSVIVIAEFYPKALEKEIMAFGKMTQMASVIEINAEIAQIAGEYRKQFLKKTGRTILLDCFLAAQAKVHHLTLVTNNRADFPMKDIKIISP